MHGADLFADAPERLAVRCPVDRPVVRLANEAKDIGMNPMHDPRQYSARIGDRTGLGALLLMWLFDRLECGICGPNPLPPRPLKTAVHVIDPGYCLDAPEAMPAGGMTNFLLPPDEPGEAPQWLPEQQLCERA